MSTANLNLLRLHPQRFARNAVRCFSHNTAHSSGFPVRYISKKRRDVDNKHGISLQQGIPSTSDSAVFRRNTFQGLRSKYGAILNHWDGDEKDLTGEKPRKVHKQAVDSTVFPRKSFQGLRVNSTEAKMLKSEDISLQQGIPFSSDSTVFLRKRFQGLRVDSTEGKMLKNKGKSKGPILSHWDGHEKDLTDEEHIKVHKQAVDCMKTGEVVVHNSLTYKSGGLREGIILNEEFGSVGLVDEEFLEASEEVFEDVQSNNTYFNASDKIRKDAEKLAAQLLARRAYTAVEIQKKLVAKLFPLNIVEGVVHDFQNRGLINDSVYAESFSHSRWKSSSWGPGRIKHALSMKGVKEADVEKAVKLVFEDCEEGEERSSVGLSSSSLQQLYIQASKHWQRSRDVEHEKRKARVIGWLQYRGFDWSVVGIIVKKLECEDGRGIMP